MRLETERLALRPFTRDDADLIGDLYGNTEVMAVRKAGVLTREQSDLQLATIVDHWERRGFGMMATEDLATGTFVGECGLRESGNGADGVDDIELSYGFFAHTWGQGFATEAALAVVTHGLVEAGLDSISAIAKSTNASSRRVLEKCGFSMEREWQPGDHMIVRYVVGPERV